jgi:hypothetical protein
MRNALRALRATKEQGEASKQLPTVVSMIDKLVKSNQIHKNKAGNLKSKLTKFVAKMNEVKEEKVKKSTKGKSTTAKKTTKKAK